MAAPGSTTSTNPLVDFASEWNLLRPDLALVGISESARHANVLRVSGREWFQVLYRTANGPARYEVGVACDDNDPSVNGSNMVAFAARLRGACPGLREYGKVVRYLTVAVPVTSAGGRPAAARQASQIMGVLIRTWGA